MVIGMIVILTLTVATVLIKVMMNKKNHLMQTIHNQSYISSKLCISPACNYIVLTLLFVGFQPCVPAG